MLPKPQKLALLTLNPKPLLPSCLFLWMVWGFRSQVSSLGLGLWFLTYKRRQNHENESFEEHLEIGYNNTEESFKTALTQTPGRI